MLELVTEPKVGTARTARTAAILSVATELPAGRLTNAELESRYGIDESWIVSRTGIRERRRAEPDERLSDYAARAGAAALEAAGVRADELDLVLVATMTQDELTPNTAPLVAKALGRGSCGSDRCGGGVHRILVGSRARRGSDRVRPRGERPAHRGRLHHPHHELRRPALGAVCSATPRGRSCWAAEGPSEARSARSCSAATDPTPGRSPPATPSERFRWTVPRCTATPSRECRR